MPTRQIAATAALCLLVITSCSSREAGRTLPVLRTIGTFELVDQKGEAFGSDQLTGQPYVVSFFFTRCPSICPEIMGVMRGLQDRLVAEKVQARLVSFTVDPENDKPEALSKYATELGAEPMRWALLTGEATALKDVVSRQFVTYMGEAEEQPSGLMDIGHGGHLLVIDSEGRLRATHEATDPVTPDRILAELQVLTGSR